MPAKLSGKLPARHAELDKLPARPHLSSMIDRPRSFGAFWPYYLMAHRDPRCRSLHFVGSTGALLGLIAAVAFLNPLYALAGLVFAYAMAWTGHFALERNRPATFGNPLWSLIGDIRMYLLWLSGRLGPALAAAEIAVEGNVRRKA
jgi:hypothetical protein